MLTTQKILFLFNYHDDHPPSTIILAPLMYDDLSDSKNSTGPAISSGFPNLNMGILYFLSNFILSCLVRLGKGPGEIELNLIFLGEKLQEKYLVICIKLAFVAP